MADFNPVLNFTQGLQAGQAQRESQRLNQVRDLQNALAGQASQGGFNPSTNPAFQQLAALDPDAAAKQLATFQALDENRQKAFFLDARQGKRLLESGDMEGFMRLADNRLRLVNQIGGDPSDTVSVLNSVASGDIDGAIQQLSMAEKLGIDAGYLSDPKKLNKSGLASAKTMIFDNGTTAALLPDGTTQVTDPSGKIVSGEERTKVLRRAREEQIGFAQEKARASAAGKVEGEAQTVNIAIDTKRKMIEAVKLAEADAKSRGETLGEVGRLKASMPGLLDVVGQLKELAYVATSTIGGKIFDTAAKELGFGSTKGATASAKFSAIVDNQILPLLKQTFGSAFTESEGERLKRTLGDVDASPEQRVAQLNAFIDGKYREIQNKERELGLPVTPTGSFEEQGKAINVTDLSDDDLFK